ncbi:carbohydrate ABC transporter permease [Streptococcus parauberis]|uniref:N-Acetyl-D-glucosamine ABC transport system, permease protein 2 n=1 Tax=Streptococcus parauberis KRS-02083 TaxID=1207545 RepID=A0ABP2SWQ7_9STRE|nr:carbohydrate ABC transporter permease [Streptococcus parauberis]AUT05197.1 L-arabinose transport system permease protein AraQ [Streptococcus parauberis]EMG24931.1 N-Acetyl-D-glucosamine ABC transport system, permease protein 2 [Streptococcus parauberis KRS-02083]KYP17087.1 L-arabinose transport system permease protein AraQ [Streptococcus parauberis]KYP17277.1 L-arabinose transport system permease protein AraQ [Streptococcus parauberis]KYP17320.1 L-arabinose transport system permease protein
MKQSKTAQTVSFVILAVICLFWILPLIWAIFTSFKSQNEIASTGFSFFPKEWTFDNYQALLGTSDSTPVFQWFTNSLIISISFMILTVVVTAFSAYGFTRMEWAGRDLVFTILLGSMMFPGVINLIPNFKIISALGWANSFLAVIVPGAAGVFNLFLVKQFMKAIPKELDESATIDGANEFQIFWYVILPLIKPVLLVVALFSFTTSWNDFLWPSVVMSDVAKMPITPGLQLLQGQYQTFPGLATAGAILALVPTFLLYLIAQKYFMQSMSLQSGMK